LILTGAGTAGADPRKVAHHLENSRSTWGSEGGLQRCAEHALFHYGTVQKCKINHYMIVDDYPMKPEAEPA